MSEEIRLPPVEGHRLPRTDRRTICPGDTEWPRQLNDLGPHEPPDELHIEGSALPDRKDAIAIVGTRRPTVAGRDTARVFARAFAEAGFTVVSGMALGIDTQAHLGALDAAGRTVAVLGCGLDIDYPKENRQVRQRIIESGAVLTEYPEGTEVHPGQFPARNRIIAGLADAVVVVEGSDRSGASITARLAFDMDRSIFAVPGSLRNPYAACPNELIRTNLATMVLNPQHVFDDLAPGLVWDGSHVIGSIKGPKVEGVERQVLNALDDAPAPAQDIQQAVGVPAGRVSLALAKLEVRGLINRRYTGAYALTEGGLRALQGG